MFGGTWNSGDVPQEIVDYQLMREFPWSYPDLAATPVGVRQYCWDFLLIERALAQEKREKAERAKSGEIRIAR